MKSVYAILSGFLVINPAFANPPVELLPESPQIREEIKRVAENSLVVGGAAAVDVVLLKSAKESGLQALEKNLDKRGSEGLRSHLEREYRYLNGQRSNYVEYITPERKAELEKLQAKADAFYKKESDIYSKSRELEQEKKKIQAELGRPLGIAPEFAQPELAKNDPRFKKLEAKQAALQKELAKLHRDMGPVFGKLEALKEAVAYESWKRTQEWPKEFPKNSGRLNTLYQEISKMKRAEQDHAYAEKWHLIKRKLKFGLAALATVGAAGVVAVNQPESASVKSENLGSVKKEIPASGIAVSQEDPGHHDLSAIGAE